ILTVMVHWVSVVDCPSAGRSKILRSAVPWICHLAGLQYRIFTCKPKRPKQIQQISGIVVRNFKVTAVLTEEQAFVFLGKSASLVVNCPKPLRVNYSRVNKLCPKIAPANR